MLLTILKIIGIILLIMLGLIFLILLMVLFVPVRYHGKGSYSDGMYTIRLRASWLLHIISVNGSLQREQDLHVYLKILGITIYDSLKTIDRKRKNKKVKSTKTKTRSTGEIQAASSEDIISEETIDEEAVNEAFFSEDTISEDMTVNNSFQNKLADSDTKKSHIFVKIKKFFIKFVNFFQKIKFTFNKVCDTIVRIKNNIKYYLEVLQLDSTKQAIATGKKQLGYVLKKLFPRKYRVNLHLGFDDPAMMGEVLAVWGMFYPVHQGNIDIQPEFDHAVMEGDFFLQGHISVFVFVRVACVLFFDKDIKHLIRQLKCSDEV